MGMLASLIGRLSVSRKLLLIYPFINLTNDPLQLMANVSPAILRKLKVVLWVMSVAYALASAIVPEVYGNTGIPADAMANFVKAFRWMAIVGFCIAFF